MILEQHEHHDQGRNLKDNNNHIMQLEQEDTMLRYVFPNQTLSATNEESELALVKGLRTGKLTV